MVKEPGVRIVDVKPMFTKVDFWDGDAQNVVSPLSREYNISICHPNLF